MVTGSYLPILVEAALAEAVGEDEADEGGVDAVAASAHLDVPVHLDGHLYEVRLHVHRPVDRRHADRLRARRHDHVSLRVLVDLHAVHEHDEAAVVLVTRDAVTCCKVYASLI